MPEAKNCQAARHSDTFKHSHTSAVTNFPTQYLDMTFWQVCKGFTELFISSIYKKYTFCNGFLFKNNFLNIFYLWHLKLASPSFHFHVPKELGIKANLTNIF